jgi:putative membrane protein
VRWLSLPTDLVALHLLANVVWIGALLSAAHLASRAAFMADSAEIGRLARRVYTRLAAPAFGVSFATGLTRILLAPDAYLRMPWMHAKLTFALAIIVLHHVIGARCRRIGQDHPEAGRGMTALGLLTFAAAAGAVFLGIFKSLP